MHQNFRLARSGPACACSALPHSIILRNRQKLAEILTVLLVFLPADLGLPDMNALPVALDSNHGLLGTRTCWLSQLNSLVTGIVYPLEKKTVKVYQDLQPADPLGHVTAEGGLIVVVQRIKCKT